MKNYIHNLNNKIVHFDTGAEDDYLAHVTFFARAKRVNLNLKLNQLGYLN